MISEYAKKHDWLRARSPNYRRTVKSGSVRWRCFLPESMCLEKLFAKAEAEEGRGATIMAEASTSWPRNTRDCPK